MVYRIYVEKKPGLAHEAAALLSDIRAFLVVMQRGVDMGSGMGAHRQLRQIIGAVIANPVQEGMARAGIARVYRRREQLAGDIVQQHKLSSSFSRNTTYFSIL